VRTCAAEVYRRAAPDETRRFAPLFRRCYRAGFAHIAHVLSEPCSGEQAYTLVQSSATRLSLGASLTFATADAVNTRALD
jgi:hypothetical protein